MTTTRRFSFPQRVALANWLTDPSTQEQYAHCGHEALLKAIYEKFEMDYTLHGFRAVLQELGLRDTYSQRPRNSEANKLAERVSLLEIEINKLAERLAQLELQSQSY